jgi:hypothetical protein
LTASSKLVGEVDVISMIFATAMDHSFPLPVPHRASGVDRAATADALTASVTGPRLLGRPQLGLGSVAPLVRLPVAAGGVVVRGSRRFQHHCAVVTLRVKTTRSDAPSDQVSPRSTAQRVAATRELTSSLV